MSIIDTLITDRTEADALRWLELSAKSWQNMTDAEKAEWLSGMKGAYNATDRNRVSEAIEFLAELFIGYGYTVDIVRPEIEPGRSRWEMKDIPTPEQMEKYLNMVSTIRGVIGGYDTTPPVPTDTEGLTIEEANAIEQILVDVEDLIKHMVLSFRRSNAHMFISGHEPFPSFYSYMGRTWEELDAMNTAWTNWQVASWYLLLYGNLKEEGAVA